MLHKTLPSTRSLLTHGLAAGVAIIWLVVVWLSRQEGEINVFIVIGLCWIASALVFSLWFYARQQVHLFTAQFVLLWAIVMRLISLWGWPLFEDDQYRFMLDGCVFLEYGTPYGISPQVLLADNSLSPACADLLNWVNNPHLSTIYGPVLQWLYAAASWLAPANVSLLQVMMALCDLALVALLLKLAKAHNVLLYALCPLILKEFALTAHPDVVAVLLLLGALYTLNLQRVYLAAALLASACAAKIIALVLAPFLLWRMAWSARAVFVLVIVAWYAPFIWQGDGGNAVLALFATQWQFNPSVFAFFKVWLGDETARLTSLVLFAALWAAVFGHWALHKDRLDWPRADVLYGLFFVLSPVFNAWYAIWFLAFAVIKPSAWAWTMSYALLLTYVTGLNWMESGLRAYQIAPWAYHLMWGFVLVAGAVSLWQTKLKL